MHCYTGGKRYTDNRTNPGNGGRAEKNFENITVRYRRIENRAKKWLDIFENHAYQWFEKAGFISNFAEFYTG
ncbi:MAG: hypothetical protein ACLUFF_00295 [Acutalibacteraceae bacterium]